MRFFNPRYLLLHVDTAETAKTSQFDTLTVQVRAPRDVYPPYKPDGFSRLSPMVQKLPGKLFHVNHTDTQPFLRKN